MNIAQRIAAAGIKHPINWGDMGSSERDAWEDRQIRILDRAERRKSRQN